MLVLVSYDVNTTEVGGKRRLRRVGKICTDYGQRVQYSVFECNIDPVQWTVLRQRLVKEIDKDNDSLRFYFLGSGKRKKVEHVGAKPIPNLEDPLIV